MKLPVLLAALCGLTFGLHRIDPLVSTKIGLIRGLRDNRGYSKFLGVPYGKINGNNVFGTAVPHPSFEEIFEAYDDSNFCTQVDMQGTVSGTTDCLNLNVYVPDSASSKNRLPVMVWIHEGAFIAGSAQRTGDPHTLLQHDVIVVSINYRLGVFGFMCLDIPEVPGNTGLKDQVLALRWINENIEAFGGDANQITVYGVSVGGMSTNLHLFSSYEKLFDRAIIQSGPANSPWVIIESDNNIPIQIAEELGFNTTDTKEALSFLMDVNAETVAQAAYQLKITNVQIVDEVLTKPCIEKKFDGVENFMTEHPLNIKSNKVSKTDIIIGYNNMEMAFPFAVVDGAYFDSYELSQYLGLDFNMSNDLTEALEIVKQFYVGDEDVNEHVRWELIDFGSDFIYYHPTRRMAQKLLEDGAKNVYSYVFSYDGNSIPNKNWSGASHAEDLVYLFDLDKGGGDKSPLDHLVIDGFTKLWTNFAKYGDPTPVITELLPVKWIPITATTHPYLAIDSDLTLRKRPFHDRMAFWDLFYKQYGKYQKWYKESDD